MTKYLSRKKPEGAAAAAARAVDRLGIGHLADVPAQLLSAGQRRRLGLACLVAAPAPLWLLDEPTVTLDAASVTIVETLIAEHRAAGGLAVVASHGGLAVPDAATLDLGRLGASTMYKPLEMSLMITVPLGKKG